MILMNIYAILIFFPPKITFFFPHLKHLFQFQFVPEGQFKGILSSTSRKTTLFQTNTQCTNKFNKNKIKKKNLKYKQEL